MTKIEAYRFLFNQNRGVSFVANVLLTRGVNAAKRLKALARLIQNGREVSDAPYRTDYFTLDGSIIPLSALDTL
jgi:hypothetical protein